MKVYVVMWSPGYDDSEVAGVFSSLKKAKAAHPIPSNPRYVPWREGGWRQSSPGEWDNGQRENLARSISRVTVDDDLIAGILR